MTRGSRPPRRRTGPPTQHETRRIAGHSTRQRASEPEPKTQPTATDWTQWLQFTITALPSLAAVIALVFTYMSVQQTRDQEAHTQAQAIAQNQLTQSGQITDRFNAAITNLGSSTEDIRLGGIYALQRVMQDSPRDQPTVIQVLAAYIRDHTKPGTTPATTPPTDIQAAATVLTTRDTKKDDGAPVNLDFTNLAYANLTKAHLSSAVLYGTELTHANLTVADLTYADLTGANLSGAILSGADLTQADLKGANLTVAALNGTQLTSADLKGANFTGADLSGGYGVSTSGVTDKALEYRITDLSFADLTNAHLERTNLTGVNLSNTLLKGADLTGANLSGAILTDADLYGTSLCAGARPTQPTRHYTCTP